MPREEHMYIGGLDIGTSGCKIVLYDEKGDFVKSEYREYDVARSGGLHEIDPNALLDAAVEVLSAVSDYDISAIAVTSFGESFVMVDSEGKPLNQIMLYTDPRGSEECEALKKHFGEERLSYLTGTKPHEMYSLPKIMWLKANRPELYNRAAAILLIQDYVVYKLTGKRQIDYSLAARTACFDIKNKCWIDEMLDFCGIEKNLLSCPVPSGTAAGELTEAAAKVTGLGEKTVIVSGCHDQIAAMTGAGAFENSRVMDGTGTVECIPLIMDEAPENMELYRCGYSVVPHINGKYACYVLSYTGGATLKWFRDSFSDLSYAEMDKQVSAEPTGLLIMPHFAGAATPYMDTGSKAAVLGLTFEHGKYDIYKALMEGTAYEIKVNTELLKDFGIEPKMLVATGGGANSDVWLQIKADVLGVPVTALDAGEIGAAGTAYLAGLAIGAYDKDMRLTSERCVFRPDEERHKIYCRNYEKYKKIYGAVREVMCDE